MTDSTNLPIDAAATDSPSEDLSSAAGAAVPEAGAGEAAGAPGADRLQVAQVQLAQAVVEVPMPNPGETVTLSVAAGQTIRFQFDYTTTGDGEVVDRGNLVLPVNGGYVILEGFAQAATFDPPVELTNSDGSVIQLEDFLVAIDVPIDVLVASAAGGGPVGPLPEDTAPNQGAGFTPGDGPQILGVIDPEGPLGPTALQYTVPERENFLFDLDEEEPGDDGVPDAVDDGVGAPGADPEAFCVDESNLVNGGEGGIGLQEPTDGSAIKTTVTVNAGAVLTFSFNFLDAESPGQLTYFDFAVLVIGDQAFKLADILAADLPNIGGSFDEQTGYLTVTYTFDTAGTYDIGFAVLNEGDTAVDPALLIDDVSITGGAFADGFETDLSNWDVLGDATIVTGDFDGVSPVEGTNHVVLTPDGPSATDIEDFFGLPHGTLQNVLNSDLPFSTVISGNVLDNDSPGPDTPTTITGISYVGDPADVDVDTSVPGFVTFTSTVNNWTLEFNLTTGDYTFTLTGPYTHSGPGMDEALERFVYTITDVDGDSDSATLSICIKDDVPTVEIFGAEGGVTLDETDNDGDDGDVGGLLASATVYIYDLIAVAENYGADGIGDFSGALTIASPGVDSGLVDTLSGEAVVLTLEGGQVVGRTESGGLEVFRISFDNGTGDLTITQSRAIVHDDPTDHDEAGSPATLAPGVVGFAVTITDGDGDTATDSFDLGSLINFEDDGPTVAISGAEGALVTLDETVGAVLGDPNANDEETAGAPVGAIGFASIGFYDLYNGAASGGSDGIDEVTLALSIPGAGTDSGMDDTATGGDILLYLEGGVVVGRVGGPDGEISFTISIDGENVVVSQFRAIEHDDPNDPEEPGGSAESIDFGAVSVTITVTDGDGDTASDTADLGSLIRFEDDGPIAGIAFKEGAEIRLDETDNDEDDGDVGGLLANVTVLGSVLFTNTTDYGSDGEGSTSYALSIPAGDVDSGLVDSQTNEQVFLFEDGGTIYGVYGTDAADAFANFATQVVFTVSVDPATGDVTVQQHRAVEHDDPADPDESASPAMMNSGVLSLVQSVTDGDGDGDSASIDLGSIIKFEDDGPTANLGGAEGAITVDESVGTDAGDPNAADETDPLAPVGAIGFAQVPFASLYPSADAAGGSDGLDHLSGVLTLTSGTSGFTDTASGENIVLVQLDDFTIVGRTETGLETVFEITLDGTSGLVTVTQFRAMVHGDTASADEFISFAAGLVGIDVTVTDGDGDTITLSAELGSLIRFEDDGPSLLSGGADTTTVDEDDLPAGSDGSDPLSVSGSIGVDFGSDGPGDVTGISGPAGLTSGGQPVTYAFDPATNTLTASAGGEPVFTVEIDVATGNYTFTLAGPIDHGALEDSKALQIDFTVTDGDGDPVSSSFTVNVTDDEPQANDDSATVEDGVNTINLVIMFDRSGSMDEDPGVDGFSTRIDLARAAIASLLQAYESVADVNILIVDFAGEGAPYTGLDGAANSGWLGSVEDAIAYMAGLTPLGYTDYSAAVGEVQSAYGVGLPSADETIVYFLSDGNPTVGGDPTTHQLTPAQVAAWESFLTTNGIDTAFAVGVGAGVTNIGALEDIAFPNEPGDNNPVVVTDESALFDTLLITVSGEASGNVLANDDFGADGPDSISIASIVVNGSVYAFDGVNITKDGGPFLAATSVLVLVTALGGTLTFNFLTGEYGYDAATAGSESFEYTIVDDDGDTSTGTLVIDVNENGVQEPHLVFGTDGADNLLGHDDAIPDIMSGGDGNDRLDAFGSNDLLIGGGGADALFGGGGDDVLIGGSQSEQVGQPGVVRVPDLADYLDGGAGKDVLFGNEGDDILVVRTGDEAHGGLGGDLFILHDNVNFGLVAGDSTPPLNLAGVGRRNILAFDGELDLTALDGGGVDIGSKITGIETLSMRDSDGITNHPTAGLIDHGFVGADTLTLNAQDVIDLGSGVFDPSALGYGQRDAIRVDGDVGDVLNLQGGGWVNLGVEAGTPGYNVWAHDPSGAGTSEDAYVLVQTTITVNAS